MGRPRYLVWLAVAFLVALVPLVWRLRPSTERESAMTARWPGGQRVVVWATTRGTQHVLQVGRWPQLDSWRSRFRWLTNVVGPKTEQLKRQSQRDVLHFYFTTLDTNGVSSPEGAWLRASVDDHGCRIGSSHSRGYSRFLGTNLMDQDLEVFPRRLGRFEVLFAGYAPITNELRVVVPNPMPWTGVDWEPDSFPVTATNAGLEVTFERWGGSLAWPTPLFEVALDGQPTDDWEAFERWYEDVTGNLSRSTDLCRWEKAWLVKARFARKARVLTNPNNAWTLLRGELPAEGEGITLGATNTLEGVSVRVVALGGKGRSRFESRGEWHLVSVTNLVDGTEGGSLSSGSADGQDWMEATSPKPWVALTFQGLTPDHHWQIVTLDEAGHVAANAGWSSVGGNLYFCELPAFQEPRRGELRLVLERYRDVTFLVPPPPRATAPVASP